MAVFFDEVRRYRQAKLQASIAKAFDLLNLDTKGKKSVFIKVNIVRPGRPSSCVITHPAVAEALIHVLRKRGLHQIVVGEGPAAGVDVETAFKRSGYLRLSQRLGVPLLDLHKAERVTKEWDYGLLDLPLEVIESDIYINVIKMKTHFHTGVTLSIKGQQGLLTPEAKKVNHREHDLHQSLVSIAKVVRPDLVIVDAIDSMEGEGPTTGQKKHTRVMVYGDDPFETDVACCRFMGVEPSQIQHVHQAIQQGLTSSEPEIKGEAFSRHKTTFKMPSPKPKKIINFYSWKNYRVCAEGDHCFEEAIHLALVRPKYWFTFFPKFLFFVLFKRFHLLRGKKAQIPKEPGRILCIGDCSQEAAEEIGAHFVPGCPPQPEDILKTISRMK